MNYSIPRPAFIAFLLTALFYLVSVSFITYPMTTFLKPIPIICLMIGILQTDLIRWAKITIIIALGYSMLGDIVLSMPIKHQVELGIGFFFLAHCCYIILFLKNFRFNSARLAFIIPVIAYCVFVLYLILPHLGELKIPVLLYFCVLFLMVFNSFQVKTQNLLIALGGVSFMISDSILASNMFVVPHLDLTLVIMSTYYLAQGLLTLGLAAIYKQ